MISGSSSDLSDHHLRGFLSTAYDSDPELYTYICIRHHETLPYHVLNEMSEDKT